MNFEYIFYRSSENNFAVKIDKTISKTYYFLISGDKRERRAAIVIESLPILKLNEFHYWKFHFAIIDTTVCSSIWFENVSCRKGRMDFPRDEKLRGFSNSVFIYLIAF